MQNMLMSIFLCIYKDVKWGGATDQNKDIILKRNLTHIVKQCFGKFN